MSAPSSLRRLFGPRLTDDAGKPVKFIWVGDECEALCINPNTMRVYAMIWSEPTEAKYYPTIYVSVWRAIYLLSIDRFVSIRLRSFPYIALELVRDKCESMDEACDRLEEEIKFLGIL